MAQTSGVLPDRAVDGIDALAERALALIMRYTPPKMMGGRTGGVITARVIETDYNIHPRQVGVLSPEKLNEKLGYIQKKHDSLRRTGHVSTFVDRDEKLNIWGGGILVGGVIIAFSGLPEECDEALCMVLASWTGLISPSEIEHILSFSRNQVWPLIPKQLLGPQKWV